MNLAPFRYCLGICVLGGLMSLVLGMAGHASQSGPDTAAIARFVDGQMRVSRIPGIALVIVRGERVVYAGTFGDDGAPLTPDSPFLIGSVTKTFTALAIAQLADGGKLRFDDPVHEHLPGFTLKGSDGGRTISLRHLLTHTSGLSQWSGHDRRAQRQARFDHIAPVRPPGVEVEYSSLNYIILGQVVEAVAGMPYGAYMRRRVFEPLDMTNSFADLDSARGHGLARGHWYFFGLAIPGRETQQPDPLVPAGFLISSAQDLGNYLGMLLGQGRFQGRQVVSPEALREMFTPWDGGRTGAGMGWGVGSTLIGHAGNSTTFSARLAMLPAEEYGIVLLTNVNSGPFFPGTAAVMDGVIRILRGHPVDTVWPREILLKLGILALLIVSVIRMIVTFRRWSRRGFPRRLKTSRRVLMPIVREAVGAAFVLLALPQWIGVPLRTIMEYFPDLGIAIVVGVVTGAVGALMRAFVLADATAQAAAAAG
jgi:CubicO group peptidase (beta-lactamase class C family)